MPVTRVNEYVDAAGRAHLRQSVVAMLDILGTSESAAAMTDEKLNGLLDITQRTLRIFDPTTAGFGRPYPHLSYTDNTLVGSIISTAPDEHVQLMTEHDALALLFSIARYQLELTCQQLFVRGGIAVGPAFIGSHMAHGQAVIDAHETEANHAHVPRVLLHDGALAMAKRCWNWDMGSRVRFYQCLARDPRDEAVFVHYLAHCELARVLAGDDGTDWLQMHRDAVLKELTERRAAFKPRAAIIEKIKWIATYHNWYAASVDRSDLVIPHVRVDAEFQEFKAGFA